MKLFLYVKILVLIFINSLLFAASLGGTVLIDNNDHGVNFNGKTLIIEDEGNTFGTVRVTSTGSFVFPKTVSDNKNHAYSLKLTQLPDSNGYICTLNQASGTVFIHDKTDLVVSCEERYYASLGGTVIIDNNDHVFNFNGKTLIIEDTGNIFGSVTVTSTGSFVFPNKINDNKSHEYSLKLTQLPDNNGYICIINQASGTVFIHDKTDLVVSCKGKYYVSVNVSGLSNGDTYALTYNNQTLSINNNSTETFPQWFYTNFTYSFKPTFNYTTSNYKRCSNNTNGTITNNLTIYIVCNTSTFNQVEYQPKARIGAVSWTDNSGNAYMFGGFNGISYLNDLWKFNGTSWSPVTNTNGGLGTPSARYGAVSWTDNAGNAYVFGGDNGNLLNDLWKFNGTSWSPVTNVSTPLSGRSGAVAWKDSSGNVYVFGGYDNSYLNDLWRFNGTSWSPVTNAGTPPSGRQGAVAWTDNAGNAYVFGGRSGPYSYFNNLWRFDGTSWSEVTNAGTAPNVRYGAVAWKDSSGNAYVFGGYGGIYYNDLWKFNGTIWSEVTNAGTAPSVRNRIVALTDNVGNAYVFGGTYVFSYYNDLWKFTTNNTTWTQLTNVTNAPSVRNRAVALTDNAGNTYVFGGNNGASYFNDLWRFDGTRWTQLIVNGAGGSPSVRSGAVSWTDNAGNAYLFGGHNGISYFNDLWRFNGTIWSPVTNTNGGLGTPSGRYGAVAWTDNAGNAYVFGGNNGTYLNDLWKFNGTSWSPVTNAGTPPSVRDGAVAWSDNAGNAYVFGGNNGTYLNDLWKFNGTSWYQVTNTNGGLGTPSGRYGAVAWTDNAGNAYVFGGNNGTYLNDLWRFNGTRWSPVTIAGTSPSIRLGAVAWTDNAGNAYVFGGNNSNYLNDLYVIK